MQIPKRALKKEAERKRESHSNHSAKLVMGLLEWRNNHGGAAINSNIESGRKIYHDVTNILARFSAKNKAIEKTCKVRGTRKFPDLRRSTPKKGPRFAAVLTIRGSTSKILSVRDASLDSLMLDD